MIDLIFRQLSEKYWAVLYSLLIIFLCAMPSENIPDEVDDKLAHFLAFGGVGFLYYFLNRRKWLMIGLGVLLGIGIEVMQGMLPESFHRGYDVWDMVYDAMGVLIGTLGAFGFQFVFSPPKI